MDPVLDTLRAALKRVPERVLRAGDLPPLAAGGEECHVRGLDAASDGTFDLVVWRPGSSWTDRLLRRAGERLAERGRLWIVARPGLRRRLVEDLGRLGFAILGEQALDGRLLVEARHDGFTVRAYETGDEEDILRLFAPAFHVSRSLEHWRWKYAANPWGRALITVAFSPSGELAAHYAGYPVPFYLPASGETLMSLQIGDTMTDPRFRRAGRGVSSLLGRCFRHFFARHCDGKIAFNYGFNTGNIRRFNFQFIKGRLAQEVGFWRVEAAALSPSPAGYAVEEIGRHALRSVGFDRFLRRVAGHYGFLVRRDAAWLGWRYLDCPDDPPFRLLVARRREQLAAWGVFRRRAVPGGDQLVWADALTSPRHSAAAADLLRAALDAEPGVREVVAWFPPQPVWWRRTLETLRLRSAPEPSDLALIYLPFTRPDVEHLLPAAYYAMGDGDLA